MKKLLLTFTLLFSTLIFSTPSYGEWTKVIGSVNGDILYVDFERIRKHGEYVYYWELSDYLKPIGTGYFSTKMYKQVDCKLFRFKYLSGSFHKESMGNGPGTVLTPKGDDTGWKYLPPNSSGEKTLKAVCNQ